MGAGYQYFYTVQNALNYLPRRDSGPACDVAAQPVTTVDRIRDRSRLGRPTSVGFFCVFFSHKQDKFGND